MKRALFTSLVVVSITVSLTALAEPSETDRSLAESLFEQGKSLLDAGNYAEACPKLEESERLDPGGGTLLNLALCHERQGKLASAWSDFKEALGAARRDGRADRADAAQEHIAALEPKLPKLAIVVQAAVEGESISLDGAALGRAVWGSPVPVDPGTHHLSASAPGKKSWSGDVTLAVAEAKTTSIPELAAAPLPPAASASTGSPSALAVSAQIPSSTAPAPSPEAHRGNAAAWILGGSGLVALGVGSVTGAMAISKRHKSSSECPTDTTCTDQGVTWNNQAKTLAWVSDVGIGVGVVAIAVSSYLLLSHGSADEHGAQASTRRLALDGDLGPAGARLGLSGAF
ncbi:MAG TPA: hypothetical protein VGI10_18080 [Polyangiaceae bacterium]|jgi:hypothetical protein